VPAVVKIDKRRRIVISTFYGDVNGEELLGHAMKIQADPEFNPAYSEIVDLSGVTSLAVSDASLAALSGRPSLFRDSSLHILVAPAELEFRAARSYQEMARDSRPKLYVVRSLEQAYRLLDSGVSQEQHPAGS
jgi:hypothetical protein